MQTPINTTLDWQNPKYKNFIFFSSFGALRGILPWGYNNNKRNSWIYSGVGQH